MDTAKKILEADLPILSLISDAAPAILKGFQLAFGCNPLYTMCWFHMLKNVDKKMFIIQLIYRFLRLTLTFVISSLIYRFHCSTHYFSISSLFYRFRRSTHYFSISSLLHVKNLIQICRRSFIDFSSLHPTFCRSNNLFPLKTVKARKSVLTV